MRIARMSVWLGKHPSSTWLRRRKIHGFFIWLYCWLTQRYIYTRKSSWWKERRKLKTLYTVSMRPTTSIFPFQSFFGEPRMLIRAWNSSCEICRWIWEEGISHYPQWYQRFQWPPKSRAWWCLARASTECERDSSFSQHYDWQISSTDMNIRLSSNELKDLNKTSVMLADGSGDYMATIGELIRHSSWHAKIICWNL